MGMSYVARKPCGCVSMAIVDNPDHKGEVAREVAKAVRLGETVDRLPVEDVRTMPWKCSQHSSKNTGVKG